MPKFDVASAFTREATRLDAVRKGTKTAIDRAASTLVRRLPVEARRDIQNEYNLKASRISKDLKATKDATSVTLTGYARPIGLIEFSGKWRGRKSEGASAQVFAGKGSHNYGGTFIAIGRNGNRQIFDRGRIGGKRAPRLPLKTLYGPSVASMLRKGDREERLADLSQSILAIEIDRLLSITS
jgi:hypothetical protein